MRALVGMDRDPLDLLLRPAAVAAVIAFVSLLTFVPVGSNDFWVQAAVGRDILATGSVPESLQYPFTEVRDAPFHAHEWLPSILFFALHRWLGDGRLVFALGAIGLIQFALVAAVAGRLTRSVPVSLLLGAMAMAGVNYRHYLRPESLACMLMLALLLLLYWPQGGGDRTRSARRLWLVLPLEVLWANVHGSFILGPIIVAVFGAGQAMEAGAPWFGPHADGQKSWKKAFAAAVPYALAAAGMLLAALMNPQGVGLISFAVAISQSPAAKAYIFEWLPTFSPVFRATPGFAIFIAGAAAALAALLLLRRRAAPGDIALFMVFLALALTRNRYIVYFGFVAPLVLAHAIGRPPAGGRRERRLLAGVLVLAVAGAALVHRFGNAYGAYPYEVTGNNLTLVMREELESPRLSGNVYNSYELGAEVIYRYHPRLLPSIDSRIDSYGDAYFLGHLALLHDEDAMLAFLDRYRVGTMLLLRRDFDEVKRMDGLRSGWRIRRMDHKAVLLERIGEGAPATPANGR